MDTDTSKHLRLALAQFATGVTIITTLGPDGEPIGVTANSFNSVSLEPPCVLWSLADSAYSSSVFQQAAHFCVHVLTDTQEQLSHKFATAGADKFGGLAWGRGIGSVPVLEEFVARFECRKTHQFPVGDHTIFVGEVLAYQWADRRPLVFHSGRYAQAERRRRESLSHEFGETAEFLEKRRNRQEPPR
jgi:flavin reductase (DIM6/NTAB) family NADH-FMN oxidoreductase RutF